MKVGDIVKVKYILNRNAYMKNLSGCISLLVEKEVDGRITIMTQGRTWYVWHDDVELL